MYYHHCCCCCRFCCYYYFPIVAFLEVTAAKQTAIYSILILTIPNTPSTVTSDNRP